jgi:predicted enzyme related to lactoylglutathione lyase
MKNAFCHVEIPVSDLEKATAFYGGLFDWKVEAIPEMHYVSFDTGAPPGGGFRKAESAEEGLGVPLNYILVDDVEATLEKAKELGAGKVVVGKTPVPDMGWFAVFLDPDGNPVAIWQEKSN